MRGENPPLRWEEIPEMYQKPLWIHYASKMKKDHWCMIVKMDPEDKPLRLWAYHPRKKSLIDDLFYIDYGERWLAFREEVTDESHYPVLKPKRRYPKHIKRRKG